MRILVSLKVEQTVCVPVNHQEHLTGVIYNLLSRSDAEFAAFLHDLGYGMDEGRKRFKLFTFSPLRCRTRRLAGEELFLGPGEVEWMIASPVEQFLRHCATGLLSAGSIRVDRTVLPITSVQTLAQPDFSSGTAKMRCLSPIVAGVPRPEAEGGGTQYLRTSDGEILAYAIRGNLCSKHRTLYGRECLDPRLSMEFDTNYLERHRGGDKLITYKDIQIRGVLAPFTVSGTPELLEIGYECGFGEKNASGFGMVEVRG